MNSGSRRGRGDRIVAADTIVGRAAVELADMVARGDISAVEVVSAHLAHIDRSNADLNAFLHVAHSQALDEARRIDRNLRRGEIPGSLVGVPFSVKDVISVAGMPLSAGSHVLGNNVGTEDASSVGLLRQAGAVCLGKTNTPEFALSPLTWNELHGYTLNPLPSDAARSPGGSSGGEAAAVASSMSAVGLGTDFGGSVRWPAHCTGLTSLRPTPGRIPSDGQLPGKRIDQRWRLDEDSVQGTLQVVGPMARSVADLRAVTRVLMGSPSAEGSTDGAPDDFVETDTLSLAWCDGEGTVPTRPEIRAAIAHAAKSLGGELGSVDEFLPPALSEAADLFGLLRSTDQHEGMRALIGRQRPGELIRKLLASTSRVTPETLARLWRRRDELRVRMLEQMPDVLLMPVAAIGAPRLDEREFQVEGRQLDMWEILASSRAISLFGLPAVVVPVGQFPDGRTIGVQVVTHPGHEYDALAVAGILEHLCGS